MTYAEKLNMPYYEDLTINDFIVNLFGLYFTDEAPIVAQSEKLYTKDAQGDPIIDPDAVQDLLNRMHSNWILCGVYADNTISIASPEKIRSITE